MVCDTTQAKLAIEQNFTSKDKGCFDSKETTWQKSCLDSGDNLERTKSNMMLTTFLDQNSSWVEAT